ncbi:MAG: hypothetical protein M1834_000132 [Cirrosporium novae-zelandiae]|nr:MAG: hypothetical protein M1834_000132 [Cirrosporium novae-zelandiae]
MSFHLTAENIHIENKHMLKARLRNKKGENVDAHIDLNHHIGNDNGRFEWGGHGFANTAKNVTFSIEGDGTVPVLRASLSKENGEQSNSDINLSERIKNRDGAFVFGINPPAPSPALNISIRWFG